MVVDALGLLCPLPLVKSTRALLLVPDGALVELHTDDIAALEDVPSWCAERRHEYLGVCRADKVLRFFFRKALPEA